GPSFLLLLGIAPRPLPDPHLAVQRDARRPSPARARPELRLEPPGLAVPGHAGPRPLRPRPLAPPAARPRAEGEAHRHDPRPVLPEAPGDDGGRDPPGLRAAGAEARSARRRCHLRLRAHRVGGATAARRSP